MNALGYESRIRVLIWRIHRQFDRWATALDVERHREKGRIMVGVTVYTQATKAGEGYFSRFQRGLKKAVENWGRSNEGGGTVGRCG